MIPHLRTLSRRHPILASALADIIHVARMSPAAAFERAAQFVFDCEQALREHDDVHQERVRRARQALRAVVLDLRTHTEAESKRWKGAN